MVGLTLTAVSIAELYRLAIPRQYVHWHGGPFWSPVVDQTILIILTYHVVGLTMCWAFGLIRMDQHVLPKRLVSVALALVVIPVLVFPTLMIVPWQMNVTYEWLPVGMYVDAIIRVITAFAAATVLGRYLARAFCPTADPKLDPLGKSTKRLVDLIAILVIPIMLVGWQASPAVIVLASLIAVVIRKLLPEKCDALGSFAISMPFALTFQLVFWRHLHAVDEIRGAVGFPYWPSDGSPPWVMLIWLLLVAMVPLWLREKPSPPSTDLPFPNGLDDDDRFEIWIDEEHDEEHPDDGDGISGVHNKDGAAETGDAANSWDDDADHWQDENRLGGTLEFNPGSESGFAGDDRTDERFNLLHGSDDEEGDSWKNGDRGPAFDEDQGDDPNLPSKPR